MALVTIYRYTCREDSSRIVPAGTDTGQEEELSRTHHKEVLFPPLLATYDSTILLFDISSPSI